MLFRVTLVTRVGWELESQKHTSSFIGPYQVLKIVKEVAYKVVLLPSLSNLYSMFHVSQLHKYVSDSSYVIQVDDMQIRDNLNYETSPLQIEDRELKCNTMNSIN